MDDVKTHVDAIDTFPIEAERPIITEVLMRKQVINVAVAGEADERTLKRLAERVRDEISAIPGITQVELGNARPYEVSVEVSEEALRRFGMTFDEVAGAIRRTSMDLPGGSIKTEGGEILLRTKGQAYHGTDFEALVLRTYPDGTRLTLGEVATVVDGFAETDQSALFEGKPSVLVRVFRVGDQNALDISRLVANYVREAAARMPVMRLRPGLNNNLTIMQLGALRHRLFQRKDKHKLPAGIIPLCNNSALGSIIATMPMFNAHGLDPTWVEPSAEQAQKFFDNLSERAIREETNLVRATTDEEVAYIATRVEEANLAAEASSVGFTEWETSDAEVILEEDPAGEDKAAGEQSGAAAESSSDEDAAEEQPQEEPPAPKKAKRVLRKAASGVPANQTS
jgi:hypothetical protein